MKKNKINKFSQNIMIKFYNDDRLAELYISGSSLRSDFAVSICYIFVFLWNLLTRVKTENLELV